jgi:hypothetical protein
MTVARMTISLTQELHSAVTMATLDKHTAFSRQIEIFLRENPEVQRYLKMVQSEPDVGVPLVHGAALREKARGRKLL